jgi:phospholipase/carboxylesterase
MKLNQRGPLKTHEVMGDDKKPVIILFHGYGADAFDLAPLSEVTPGVQEWSWLFPQGPCEVPIGPGWTGRAWWPIDLQKISSSSDISTESPKDLPEVRKKVFSMIDSLRRPWSEIILGGFSQGGMLAADIALHAPENPRGLLLLSTALINKSAWQSIANQRKGLRFFQAHGTQDTVIDIKNGQRLESFLTGQGLVGRLRQFSGGHEIPNLVLQEMGNFLVNSNT